MIPEIDLDNSLERWLPVQSQELKQYQNFIEDFGSDALLILVLDTRDNPQAEKSIDTELLSLEELDYVMGVGNWPARYVQHKKPAGEGYTTYLIRFRPESHSNPNRPELLDRIDAIMNDRGMDYHLAGTGVIARAINQQTSRDATRFLLTGILVLLVFVVIVIGDLIAILQTLLVALAAIASLVFISVLAGIPLSIAHTVIPLLILFYSTSISMHVLSHKGDFRKILVPAIWVSSTTVLGFSAFLFSGIPLLTDFAVLGITGIAGVFGASILMFYPNTYRYRKRLFFKRIIHFPRPDSRWLVPASLALCLVAFPGIWQLKSEIYSLAILDPSSKAFYDHEKVEELVGPYFPLEYVIDDERTPRNLISRWVHDVYDMPEVGAVASFHRFPPLQDLQAIGYRSKADPDKHRITFFVPLMSTSDGKLLTERIDELGKPYFKSQRPLLQGFMTLYANIADALLEAFRQSLLFGFIVISIIMAIYLGRWKLLLPAMVVNILPILVMLGLMGWLNIRLDMVTIPIGCLLLSIVVDDTFHFMHWYKVTRDEELALQKAGPGIVITSFVICSGFVILLLSGSPPVRYFGLLSISAIAMALLGDILLLPHFLRLVHKKNE
ncbi:RND family transporter [Robiginitalea sp. SC105]|uniref:efflux RND transporter permease subunit n=1 Tax=Robiginitalea sp. SC105 TaxID=2762332 RepID=UPI0016398251|nr:MMPL family transporter [Robiginitalea sp. SC105]MBC2838996.1 MMPL family transporter [Robiginitalea sp. SC105]